MKPDKEKTQKIVTILLLKLPKYKVNR